MSLSDSLESLKNFDINELDFNNAGSWPGPIKAIAFALVFALILGGGYWFFIKDQYTKYDRVTAEEQKLKKQYETKAFKVANLAAYKAQMNEMEESFGALLKQLPSDTEVPGLLEDITNTGLGSGLKIKSIKLNAEVSREFYIELPMEIRVVGAYHDLGSFVSGVASLPRIVTLHDFDIKPVKSGNGSELEMHIIAKTYRYNPGSKKNKRKARGGRK